MKHTTPWWRRILNVLTGKTAAPSPAKPKTTKHDPYVYVTITGKKFHYDPNCQHLQNAWSRGEVYKVAISKARSSGRTACDRCCYDYLHE